MCDLGIGVADISDDQQHHDRAYAQPLAARHREPEHGRTDDDRSEEDCQNGLQSPPAVQRGTQKRRGERGDQSGPFRYRGNRCLALRIGRCERLIVRQTGKRTAGEEIRPDDVPREIGCENVDDDEDVIGIAGPFEDRPGKSGPAERTAFTAGLAYRLIGERICGKRGIGGHRQFLMSPAVPPVQAALASSASVVGASRNALSLPMH